MNKHSGQMEEVRFLFNASRQSFNRALMIFWIRLNERALWNIFIMHNFHTNRIIPLGIVNKGNLISWQISKESQLNFQKCIVGRGKKRLRRYDIDLGVKCYSIISFVCENKYIFFYSILYLLCALYISRTMGI